MMCLESPKESDQMTALGELVINVFMGPGENFKKIREGVIKKKRWNFPSLVGWVDQRVFNQKKCSK